MTRPSVIKVGGSLLAWNLFPARLDEYLAGRRMDKLVLVVGGGAAVEQIRELDRSRGLGEERSHQLAMHALDLTARLVAALVSGLDIVTTPEEYATVWQAGRTPVMAPRRFLELDDQRAVDPLPHSWDVTSDSIAARLARHLQAQELVLLKSASLPAGIDRAEAARRGLVDPAFPIAAEGIARVLYLNLREPGTGAVVL